MQDSGMDPHKASAGQTDYPAITMLLERLSSLETTLAELVEQVSALRATSDSQARELLAAHLQTRREMNSALRPLGLVLRPFRRAAALFTPRLYGLRHYPPRPISQVSSVAVPSSAPSISIVTPSYQQGRFIEATIASVLAQNYPNLQYVVQDGGSNDGSVDTLERHASKLHAWESCADRGQADAINRAFAKTNGELMAWLNSDDLLLPGALSAVATFFEKNPNVDVVYGNRVIIDESGLQVGRWILPSHDDEVLSWADYVPQETMFWRRRIWDKVGAKLDITYEFAMDWDLLIRFRQAGAVIEHMPRLLGAFRVHDEQKTSANISTTGAAEMQLIRQRVLGYSPTDKEIHRAISPLMRRHLLAHFQFTLAERCGSFLASIKERIQPHHPRISRD